MEWMSRIYGAEGVLEASDIDVDVGGDVGIDGGGDNVDRGTTANKISPSTVTHVIPTAK